MGVTVLLVEDEHSIGALVRTYLERDGHPVVWARSGEEALAELLRHPIGMVMLDVGLPGVDGFGVVRTVRSRTLFSPTDSASSSGLLHPRGWSSGHRSSRRPLWSSPRTTSPDANGTRRRQAVP
ncbi:MAG: response regulator [Thermoleophilia bacterium]|nr:response regulator [Thermoleophilia bacterium]